MIEKRESEAHKELLQRKSQLEKIDRKKKAYEVDSLQNSNKFDIRFSKINQSKEKKRYKRKRGRV